MKRIYSTLTTIIMVALFKSDVIADQFINSTTVDLGAHQCRIVEKNVTGRSIGAFVLVAGASSNKSIAIKKLMENAQITEGSNRFLINLSVERRVIFFIVGVAFVDIARADVVEFIE